MQKDCWALPVDSVLGAQPQYRATEPHKCWDNVYPNYCRPDWAEADNSKSQRWYLTNCRTGNECRPVHRNDRHTGYNRSVIEFHVLLNIWINSRILFFTVWCIVQLTELLLADPASLERLERRCVTLLELPLPITITYFIAIVVITRCRRCRKLNPRFRKTQQLWSVSKFTACNENIEFPLESLNSNCILKFYIFWKSNLAGKNNHQNFDGLQHRPDQSYTCCSDKVPQRPPSWVVVQHSLPD